MLEPWGYDWLVSEARDRLEAVVAAERAEGDWSITEKVPCQCPDCKELWIFLQSTENQEHIWPLAKQRRRHIHDIIDRMAIPVTHTTRRVGSPHKLTLTKTQELFKQEAARRKKALEQLKGLK